LHRWSTQKNWGFGVPFAQKRHSARFLSNLTFRQYFAKHKDTRASGKTGRTAVYVKRNIHEKPTKRQQIGVLEEFGIVLCFVKATRV